MVAHHGSPHSASSAVKWVCKEIPSSPAVPLGLGGASEQFQEHRSLGKFRGKVHSSWEEAQTAEQQGAAQAIQRSCSVETIGEHVVCKSGVLFQPWGEGQPSPKARSPLVDSKLSDENTGYCCFSWLCSQLKFLLIPVLP